MKFAAVGLLLLASSVAAAERPAPDRPIGVLTPPDLFALQYAADPEIRADGREIAYVRTTNDAITDRERRSIWLIDVDSGAQSPLVGPNAASPRWSPTGDRLAYVAADENSRPQLWVKWMASGAAAKIADLPSAPSDLAWSPDGRRIAFSMLVEERPMALGAPLPKPEGAKWAEPLKVISDLHYRQDGEGYLRPGYRQLFVAAADGGAPRQLTFGKFDADGALAWTPDGGTIVFASNREKDWEHDPLASRIWALDVAGGQLTALTAQHGPSNAPAVSPDGRQIAWVGFEDKVLGYQNAQLWLMNRDGSGLKSLTAGFDRSVQRPRWAGDGKSIFVTYGDHGATKIARVGLDGRIATVAENLGGAEPDRPYNGGAFSVSAGGVAAFTLGAVDHPSDVGLARGAQVEAPDQPQCRPFRRKDAGRGRTARCHVIGRQTADRRLDHDPAGFRSRAEISADPGDPRGPLRRLWAEFRLGAATLRRRRLCRVYANPRGSTSYGEAFADLIDKNYPCQDYDDLMSVVDAAIAKGFVDPNNLFVTGGSGGGLLTAWIVGKTDRFRAAVTQKPVIDWTSEVLTVDVYAFMARYWFGKMPWEDPDFYWRRSPLSLVGNVTTPTMVMVGEEDHRTPPSEAEQFFQALQLRSVPTVLVRVPGASHETLADRPSQEAAEVNAILAWFGEHRAPG